MKATEIEAAPPAAWLHIEHDDVEALFEAVKSWDFEILPLQPKGIRGEISLMASPASDVQFATGGYAGRIRQLGAPPAGLRTFAIPASPDFEMNWRRHEVTGDDIMLFPAGGELEAFTRRHFLVYTVSMTQERLDRLIEVLAPEHASSRLTEREVFRCNPSPMRRLQAALGRHMLALRERPELRRDYNLPRSLEIYLIRALVSYEENPTGEPSLRERSASEAERIITREARRAPTISEIALRVGVTERTLQLGFKQTFGITPKAYLNNVRLGGVRRLLRDADPARTVISDVANRWGFWHMGQFAADYRKVFGEKPSETLVRSS